MGLRSGAERQRLGTALSDEDGEDDADDGNSWQSTTCFVCPVESRANLISVSGSGGILEPGALNTATCVNHTGGLLVGVHMTCCRAVGVVVL